MATRPVKNQNTLNRWLNRYFSALIALALVVFLLLSYFFLIGPKVWATQEAIRLNLEQQQNIYAISRQKLANLQALTAMYQKMNVGDLQKFNSVLPDDYPPEKLFGELEEMISRGGWIISTIALRDVSEGVVSGAMVGADGQEVAPIILIGSRSSNLGRIDVEISIKAVDYTGFKNLVRMIESNLRLFDITKVDFSPGENRAILVLTTYYYKNIR